jgi:hypothetical protein
MGVGAGIMTAGSIVGVDSIMTVADGVVTAGK